MKSIYVLEVGFTRFAARRFRSRVNELLAKPGARLAWQQFSGRLLRMIFEAQIDLPADGPETCTRA